jgi:prolyl-tRNA synthetase
MSTSTLKRQRVRAEFVATLSGPLAAACRLPGPVYSPGPMRYSSALIPTVKEAPSDAQTTSHVLLARGGYIRRIGAGIYGFLPLGVRVLRKIEAIVRSEMDHAGALEVSLPALLPAEYFRESGRWDQFGDTLFRLKDRKRGDYHLGPTHEEIVTDLARREIRSYRDLPKNLYQIQNKFRDEPRPRAGLLRCREFTMKDAYSFDASDEAAEASYETMRAAYTRIFDRLGLEYRLVSADSGAMGGSKSAEFQVLVQSGEDFIAACRSCSYAANLEVAAAPPPSEAVAAPPPPLEKVATPGAGTIEAVSQLLESPPSRFLKSLVFESAGQLVLAVVRGDHQLNEVKMARALGAADLRLAPPERVAEATGAAVGFAGPVGFKGRVVVDRDAAAVADAITGANETDAHFVHVRMGRDFDGEVHDLRSAVAGDPCPNCSAPLSIFRGIEAGHIFILGTHYTAKMGATFLAESGESRPLIMGCYGIGVSRLMATTIEQHHDADGIVWPISIAPYQVHIVQIGDGDDVTKVADRLAKDLEARGVEVLLDDRSERPGVKFKDADLIGIPFRVNVGERGLKAGFVELKSRRERDPKLAESVAVGNAAETIAVRVDEALRS